MTTCKRIKQVKRALLRAGKRGTALLTAVAVLALVAPPQASYGAGLGDSVVVVQAQPAAAAVVYGSGVWTNTIAATTAFTNWTRIDVSAYKSFVMLEITARCDAANAGTINVSMGYNVNGNAGAGLQNPTSTNVLGFLVWPTTLNGTTQVIGVTNLTMATIGGAPFLYVMGISNGLAASGSITNYNLRVYGK